MIFGENSQILKHVATGTKIHFNAFDALVGWKQEALPPVEVPAAAKWKFRNKPSQQLVLDYDYTFKTPYCGSERVEINSQHESGTLNKSSCSLQWEDCKEIFPFCYAIFPLCCSIAFMICVDILVVRLLILGLQGISSLFPLIQARPLLVQALENENFDDLVDPRLERNFVAIEMFRMIEAAAACVRH